MSHVFICIFQRDCLIKRLITDEMYRIYLNFQGFGTDVFSGPYMYVREAEQAVRAYFCDGIGYLTGN